jgi:uncharacterized protein GlcG (DUF336 family)
LFLLVPLGIGGAYVGSTSASQIVDAALAQARREGLAPMTVAALDARGAIVALKMEDGSSLLRPEIASGKA